MSDTLESITLRVRSLVAELADMPPDDIGEHAVVFGRAPDGEPALLDSLDALKLALQLGAEYGLDMPPEDGEREVYRVREIAEYIQERRAPTPQ